MKKYSLRVIFFLILLSCNSYSQSGSSLTINEVMFYSAESNGEYVEIYNISTTETIDLANFKFRYYTSANNVFNSFIGGTLLGPGKYAVILQGNYDYSNGIYKNLIPIDAIILKLNTNNFGTSGMANTTSRDVSIINASDQTVDTYNYSADNNAGYSDEKIVLGKDNSITNWKNSIRINGSPGSRNSVSRTDYDLRVSLLDITPKSPAANDSVLIRILITNLGKSAANKFTLKLFQDVNKDTVGNPNEILYSKESMNLTSGDSTIVFTKYLSSTINGYYFLAEVDYLLDENPSDNKIYFYIYFGEAPIGKDELVINEIMYAPQNDEPEWIELYNKSKRTLNLKNCRLGDNTSLPVLSSMDYYINPDEYLVVCGDVSLSTYYQYNFKQLVKSLPSLSNNGDDIIFKNANNITVDSVKYLPAWGGNSGGKSLERISTIAASNLSTNWRTAFASSRATPGKKNSAFNPPQYAKGSLIINEIMYEPEAGKAEFLELYNTSNDSILVIGIEARIGSTKLNLSESGIAVPPKKYFVIASDSTIFRSYNWLNKSDCVSIVHSLSLSNEGTSVLIKDFYGTILDSVAYSISWHNKNILTTKNKSLERLNPYVSSTNKSNWNTCVISDGATPAKQNSIFTENIFRDARITISPNPFSPDNDGFEDFAIINLILPYKLAQVRIRVFDSQGRLVRTLQDNRPSASSNSIIFDGLDDNSRTLRIGIYILLVEITSDENNSVETIKTPIVVAKKL